MDHRLNINIYAISFTRKTAHIFLSFGLSSCFSLTVFLSFIALAFTTLSGLTGHTATSEDDSDVQSLVVKPRSLSMSFFLVVPGLFAKDT